MKKTQDKLEDEMMAITKKYGLVGFWVFTPLGDLTWFGNTEAKHRLVVQGRIAEGVLEDEIEQKVYGRIGKEKEPVVKKKRNVLVEDDYFG